MAYCTPCRCQAWVSTVAALAIRYAPFNGFFSKFPLFAAGFALSVEYWILLPP
ncbi:hypothetical protein ACLK19_16410 [Escherichia coli]